MPYSWNRPPVPIDKNKQGGKNMDASTITDLMKTAVISSIGNTKIGFNNKNIYTDINEQRRAAVIIRGLSTISTLNCQICIGPTGSGSSGGGGGGAVGPTGASTGPTGGSTGPTGGSTGTVSSTGPTGGLITSTAASALNGISFYIIHSDIATQIFSGTRYSIRYNSTDNSVKQGQWSNGAGLATTPPSAYLLDVPNNQIDVFRDRFFEFKVGLSSLPNTFTSSSSRGDIVDALDTILDGLGFTINTFSTPGSPTGPTKLRASVTADGNLKLDIDGPWYPAPAPGSTTPVQYAGLFFGNSANGSTTLGVTNIGGNCGVDSSALLIPAGQTSVTSRFQIADPSIDFTLTCP